MTIFDLAVQSMGLLAGFLTTIATLPQTVKIFKTKDARSVSFVAQCTLMVGTLVWLAYGIIIQNIPIIVWDVIAAVLISISMYSKWKYGGLN